MEIFIKSNLDTIINKIKTDTPASRKQPEYDCIAITGCEKNSIIKLNRNGEYYGFSVKALEKIKPLFTSTNILQAIQFIIAENYDAVIRLFDVKDEYLLYGYDIIYYILSKWFTICKIDIGKTFTYKFSVKDIDERLKLVRSDTINVPLEIVNIGPNVVPSEWIGKQYKSGKELHAEIDKLEWRRGKAPVTYCCIYSMTKVNIENVKLTSNFSVNDSKVNVYVQLNKNHKAKFIDVKEIKTKNYVEYNTENANLFIFFDIKNHFIEKANLEKNSVGLSSSMLQKCIRHGSCSKKLVEETIQKLGRSKPYNLPEQQFLKVSGARQLFWRMFITCIEDFRYYYDEKLINLFDILSLALICNKEPDYIISDELLLEMKNLGKELCKADSEFDYHEWRTYKESEPKYEGNHFQKVIYLSYEFMPKMSGDGTMIKKYYDLLTKYQPKKITPNKNKISCIKCKNGLTCLYTAVDIHSNPNMILKLQACINEKLSTQEISSMVWELNSKFNNRKPKEITSDMVNSKFVKILYNIQKDYYNEYVPLYEYDDTETKKTKSLMIKTELSQYNKRVLFLKLFGHVHRIPATKSTEKVLEVVFSYYDKIQIKYVNSDEYIKGEEYEKNITRVYNYFENNKIKVYKPECLAGYEWIFEHMLLEIGIINDVPVVFDKDKKYNLKWFDGSNVVKKLQVKKYDIPNKSDIEIINSLLYQEGDVFDINMFVTKYKGKLIDLKQFILLDLNGKKTNELFKNVYVKILTSYDNFITLSQVSRTGERVDDSVDYYNEGKFWNILNLLKFCYYGAIKQTSEFKYKIKPDTVEYSIMMNDLKEIINDEEKINNKLEPRMLSKLWVHQEETVNFVLSNIKEGKTGFGDASNVGAGKSLTALTICCELYKLYNKNKVLVMLPTEKLYKTWTDEIDKHISNINYLTQNANGKLEGKIDENKLNIFITTMGRNRNHPLNYNWLFLVIDECLTVQNKEAIQTMSSWKQSINSEYGVILLSATFFRTRFDKLLYMLKMLKCDLPETKDYLDTILCDSIKVNLPVNKRTWTEVLFKKEAPKKFYTGYNKIKEMELSNENKYIKLQKYIFDNINYVDIFDEYINIITEKDKKAKLLIYAKSKAEANSIAELKNVGLYPDISKKHVVVSLAHGTYGLNDLVGFNQILCRPPEPDKLPQMKGRLDRPGQNTNDLVINYIVIDKTIENGDYTRLELCNKFYSNHIMPLSEFYKIALN